MAPSSRDRISVDLRGLKAALLERARSAGTLPSAFVRGALGDALGKREPSGRPRLHVLQNVRGPDRTRLSLRITQAQAETVIEAAHRAGMNLGDYVAGVVAEGPVLANGGRRAEHVAALIASCAELSGVNLWEEGAMNKSNKFLWQANMQVYGAEQVWRQLARGDCDNAAHGRTADEATRTAQRHARQAGLLGVPAIDHVTADAQPAIR